MPSKVTQGNPSRKISQFDKIKTQLNSNNKVIKKSVEESEAPQLKSHNEITPLGQRAVGSSVFFLT